MGLWTHGVCWVRWPPEGLGREGMVSPIYRALLWCPLPSLGSNGCLRRLTGEAGSRRG